MPTIPYDCSRTALFTPERRDTVFRAGDVPADRRLAVEAARLAYVRFEESPEERARLSDALRLAGFDGLQTFNHPGSDGQGFGALRGPLALLAFRGTQPDRMGDVATDADTVLQAWKLGAGRVHAGFGHTALGLWERVGGWLDGAAKGRAQLLICGHSLGAAIATLLAGPARATQLMTIGSPRVGDGAFVNDLLAAPGLQVARIVNCCDVVTQIPPDNALFPFKHAGPAIYIDREGRVVEEATDAVMDADRLRAHAEYVNEHAFRFGTVLARDLADHAPINYIRAFWS